MSMPAPPPLPLELVVEVFRLTSPGDLKSCSLVKRSWHPFARELLLANLGVGVGPDLGGMERLLNAIASHPDRHLRSVLARAHTLTLSLGQLDGVGGRAADLLGQILGRLSSLLSLSLRYTYDCASKDRTVRRERRETLEARAAEPLFLLLRRYPQISRVTLDVGAAHLRSGMTPAGMSGWMNSSIHLRQLTLKGWRRGPAGWWGAVGSMAANLDALELHECDMGSICDFLGSPRFRNVTRVRLLSPRWASYDSVSVGAFSSFKALSEFTIETEIQDAVHPDRYHEVGESWLPYMVRRQSLRHQDATQLCDMLDALHAPMHLSIRTRICHEYVFFTIPSAVRSLSIELESFSGDDGEVLDSIRTNTRIPDNLERVSIVFDAPNDDTWKPQGWIAAAKERGFVLSVDFRDATEPGGRWRRRQRLGAIVMDMKRKGLHQEYWEHEV